MKTEMTDDGALDRKSSCCALTAAERAIVELLVHGKTNKEIARALGRSDQTVKHRLALLMRRLRVKNRTQLAHLLVSRGLLATSGPRL